MCKTHTLDEPTPPEVVWTPHLEHHRLLVLAEQVVPRRDVNHRRPPAAAAAVARAPRLISIAAPAQNFHRVPAVVGPEAGQNLLAVGVDQRVHPEVELLGRKQRLPTIGVWGSGFRV